MGPNFDLVLYSQHHRLQLPCDRQFLWWTAHISHDSRDAILLQTEKQCFKVNEGGLHCCSYDVGLFYFF